MEKNEPKGIQFCQDEKVMVKMTGASDGRSSNVKACAPIKL